MSDSGSIVLGWLTKLVVLFAVLGVVGYDGFTVVQANVSVSDDATTAANAAADAYHGVHSVQTAYDAAVKSVAGKGDVVETKNFTIASDGTVTLTIDRTPKTLWMHRIAPLRKFTDIRQSGSGAPPS